MNTNPGTALATEPLVVSGQSLARYKARIRRLGSNIQNLRDAIGADCLRQLEEGEIPDMDEGDPQTLTLLRELRDVLDQEAEDTRKAVASNETEMLQLRECIEQEIADERRQQWRQETRNRLLAGEKPDALPMHADMSFPEYFHEIRVLLKEIGGNKESR